MRALDALVCHASPEDVRVVFGAAQCPGGTKRDSARSVGHLGLALCIVSSSGIKGIDMAPRPYDAQLANNLLRYEAD